MQPGLSLLKDGLIEVERKKRRRRRRRRR